MNPTPQQIQSFSSSYGSTGTSLPSQTPNLSGVTMPRTLSAAPTQNQGESIGTMAENSSINKFGQDIGQSLAAPGNADKYASALQSWGQINQNLKIAVAKNPTNTRLQSALQQSNASEPKLSDFTGQIINKSTESILGDAAGTAVDVVGGAEGAEGVGSLLGVGAKTAAEAVAPTVAQSALKGAGIGGAYGVAGGVSNAMQNNKGVVDTAKEGLESGVIGAGAGAVLGGGITALSRSGGVAGDVAGGEAGAEATPKTSPDAELKSRIADATPSYDKSMRNTANRYVTDESGNRTPRIAPDTERGALGKPVVNSSASETAAGKELMNVKDYPTVDQKATAYDKSLAVDKAISSEAESMRGGLQAEDKTNPLNADAEKSKVIDMVKSNLPENIREKMGILSPEDKAYMKDIQEKLGVKQPPEGFDTTVSKTKLPKNAAGRYFGRVGEALNDYDGTREGKLDLRQELDSAYKEARGKLAFGSDSQNELDETHTDIRDSINKDLSQSTENTDVKSSLEKQTRLYRANTVLGNKAEEEAVNGFQRLEQNHPSIKMVSNQGKRELIRILMYGAGAATVLKVAESLTAAKKAPKIAGFK